MHSPCWDIWWTTDGHLYTSLSVLTEPYHPYHLFPAPFCKLYPGSWGGSFCPQRVAPHCGESVWHPVYQPQLVSRFTWVWSNTQKLPMSTILHAVDKSVRLSVQVCVSIKAILVCIYDISELPDSAGTCCLALCFSASTGMTYRQKTIHCKPVPQHTLQTKHVVVHFCSTEGMISPCEESDCMSCLPTSLVICDEQARLCANPVQSLWWLAGQVKLESLCHEECTSQAWMDNTFDVVPERSA